MPALRGADPSLRLTGFLPAGLSPLPWLDGVELVTAGLPGPTRLVMPLAQSTRLARAARGAGIDLMHSPANFAPVVRTVPLVVTVHDLLHRRERGLVGPITRVGVRAFVDGPARRAHRIITVSESSAADIVRFLGRKRADIDVTPLGAGQVHAPGPGEVRRPDRPRVLSLGNARPHKNLEVLLHAVALLPPDERPVLVLPGEGLGVTFSGLVEALDVSADVMMPGWVSDDGLEMLFATSSAYLSPSLFEGFGLPVLEAMQRGVPVACSDIPVLSEVAGDAALRFDPHSAESVASAVRCILNDPVRAADLAARGRARAALFTWERTAELTLGAYERALTNAVDNARDDR